MYKNTSLQKYLDDLAAKLPAPGGGSAAALAASLGASLISMVVHFTLGKPKFAPYEKDLKEIIGKSEKLKRQLLDLVDLDVSAFQSKNFRDCLNVPLMVARLSYEAIKLCPPLIKKGNPNLASDVAVAAVLLESGFTSAYFNIEINLKFSKDERLNKSIRDELRTKARRMKRIRYQTEVKVGKIIRG